MENRNIIVLGGAGFIGQNLIDYLLENTLYGIISIGHGELNNSNNRVSHYSQSITNESLVKLDVNFDAIYAIINCSGGGCVKTSHNLPLDDFYRTTATVIEVLDFIKNKCSNAKFIQLSSAAVYGNSVTLPISTLSSIKPISVYGFNNVNAEICVKLYGEIFGIKSVILRPFSVYGNGLKKQLLWDACEKFRKEKPVFYGTGCEVRDFIHIDDLCSTIYKSISYANVATPIYNCGSGIGTEIKDILQLIHEKMCVSKPPSFSGEFKEGDPIGYIADIQDAPIEISIDINDGITRYVSWYKGLNNE